MQAPIQNDKIASEIFSRSMKTPVITLTSEELLSLSPEVQLKWKEQVTSKHVPLVGDNMPAEPSRNTEIFLADPYETYLNALGPSDEPKPFVVMKESNSIRSVVMDINGKDSVESVIDGGSAIIVQWLKQYATNSPSAMTLLSPFPCNLPTVELTTPLD
jgi:hypothetical protein